MAAQENTAGFRGGVKNWRSTLTMRASAAEYRSLHLRAHEFLRDVPLYDVSSVDLPGGGSGRTIADISAVVRQSAPVPHQLGAPMRHETITNCQPYRDRCPMLKRGCAPSTNLGRLVEDDAHVFSFQ